MTQFCNFFKNGDIIYNQKNMVTGKMSAQFLDISSSFCEVIDHKDIFLITRFFYTENTFPFFFSIIFL